MSRGTSESSPGDITQLLVQWSHGDRQALDRLMPAVYDELRSLAAAYFRRESRDRTFQTTELVHEAFLRLIDQRKVRWKNRGHFFGIAAQAMRRILVDHARCQLSAKRGGGDRGVSLDEAPELPVERPRQMVALDDALTCLAAVEPEQARIVELRYFGGLTNAEVADTLDCSIPTVSRRWLVARAWLYRHLAGGEVREA